MREIGPGAATGGAEEQPAPTCPFCGSDRTELVSLFGSTSLTSHYHCANCRSAFEYVKWGTAPKGSRARSCDR